MKKNEFTEYLRKHLSIIEENELNDLISEYEQHISMKMEEEQCTEEKAIEDFGDLKELVNEILESYHVRNDYSKEKTDWKKPLERSGRSAMNFFEKVLIRIKETGRSIKQTLLSLFHRSQKTNTRSFVESVHQTVSHIVHSVARLAVLTVRLVWNCLLLFLLGLCLLAAGLLILTVGFSFIMSMMNYPLWGVTVILAGLCLSCLSLLAILFKGLKRTDCDPVDKQRIIKAATFCLLTGILMAGIGGGIAFGEYTQFEYGGIVYSDTSAASTQSVKISLEDELSYYCEPIYNYDGYKTSHLVLDDTVAEDEMIYQIEVLNGTSGQILVEQFDTGQNTVHLSPHYVTEASDMEISVNMMKAVLGSIKERKLVDYVSVPYVKDVVIRIHPVNAEKIYGDLDN